MMGSTPPSQSTLSDLKVLLELLQAASDPKQAKKVIDSIAEARKQYDDAIAESQARLAAANEAESKAEAAALKAEKAEEKLDKKSIALEAHQAELLEQEKAIAVQREALLVRATELDALSAGIDSKRAAMDLAASSQLQHIAADKKSLADEVAAFELKVKEVNDLKSEYESKIAKLKAIAE